MKNNPPQLLDKFGLKKTKIRIAIVETLLNVSTPLTSLEILEKLSYLKPNKTTIYRNLQTLTHSGLVHKAFLEQKNAVFELSFSCSQKQCHPHFICRKCGNTFCIKDLLPYKNIKIPGFIVERQKILLEGLCKKCSEDDF